MKVLLLVLLSYLSMMSSLVRAGSIEVFEREYTYNASENDSKVSARKAAMQQLQSLLIQEVGVQVQSSFDQQESLNGDDFSRKVQANYQTFSQALTKTRILKQKWDGERFYLKAEVTVDTENLIDQIRMVYVAVSEGKVKPIDCRSIHNRAVDLLAEANKPEVVKAIVEYSANYPIDEDCYRWQLGILNDFRTLQLDPEGYRENLFQRIVDEGSSYAGDLMNDVLQYALTIRPLSKAEWGIVKNTLQRTSSESAKTTIRYLVKSTKIENIAEASQRVQQNNLAYQSLAELLAKMDQIIQLSKLNQLASPKPLSTEQVMLTFLNYSAKDKPNLFFNYYQHNKSLMSKSEKGKLAKTVVDLFEQQPDQKRLGFLNDYLSDIEWSKKQNRFLFNFFLDLKENKQEVNIYPEALRLLLANHPELFAQIINKAGYNKMKKQRLLIEYGLPADDILPLQEYADKLFDKKKRDQVEAAKYLVAFGDRAAPVKAQVVKRLARIKALKKVSNPRNLIVELVQVLEHINASDKQSIEVLIWAIGDLDGEINRKAQQALVSIGSSALPHIKAGFDQQKPTAKRRLVEVMGTYNQDKKQTVAFLKTVKPESPQLKFAVEDSLAELQ